MSGRSTASGTRAPSGRTTQTLRLPRLDPRYDSNAVNNAFDLLERADARNVKSGEQPTFPGVVLLSSPSGIGYLLTVDDAGALHTTQLPATRPF